MSVLRAYDVYIEQTCMDVRPRSSDRISEMFANGKRWETDAMQASSPARHAPSHPEMQGLKSFGLTPLDKERRSLYGGKALLWERRSDVWGESHVRDKDALGIGMQDKEAKHDILLLRDRSGRQRDLDALRDRDEVRTTSRTNNFKQWDNGMLLAKNRHEIRQRDMVRETDMLRQRDLMHDMHMNLSFDSHTRRHEAPFFESGSMRWESHGDRRKDAHGDEASRRLGSSLDNRLASADRRWHTDNTDKDPMWSLDRATSSDAYVHDSAGVRTSDRVLVRDDILMETTPANRNSSTTDFASMNGNVSNSDSPVTSNTLLLTSTSSLAANGRMESSTPHNDVNKTEWSPRYNNDKTGRREASPRHYEAGRAESSPRYHDVSRAESSPRCNDSTRTESSSRLPSAPPHDTGPLASSPRSKNDTMLLTDALMQLETEKEKVKILQAEVSREKDKVSALQADLSHENDKIRNLHTELSREKDKVMLLEAEVSREKEEEDLASAQRGCACSQCDILQSKLLQVEDAHRQAASERDEAYLLNDKLKGKNEMLEQTVESMTSEIERYHVCTSTFMYVCVLCTTVGETVAKYIRAGFRHLDRTQTRDGAPSESHGMICTPAHAMRGE
jgi:hypothetical protein